MRSILWNLKVHYCIHKSVPFGYVLSQINPVHVSHILFLEDPFQYDNFHLWLGLHSILLPLGFPFRSKYLPQHPILKHPQPMFFPQCQIKSFTVLISVNQRFCTTKDQSDQMHLLKLSNPLNYCPLLLKYGCVL